MWNWNFQEILISLIVTNGEDFKEIEELSLTAFGELGMAHILLHNLTWFYKLSSFCGH